MMRMPIVQRVGIHDDAGISCSPSLIREAGTIDRDLYRVRVFEGEVHNAEHDRENGHLRFSN